ncbi:DnaD domain-containing protein [Alteribacter populi]|uniref:DnaD domain-containing protein n=1 Tax=Alteribacter populi TaxID=2011011 RepID=UPI000BBA5BEF|nr:DnaD domain-containing protein [Alteribacter populi]
MNNELSVQLIMNNPLSLPAILVEYYAKIGISEQEMMLLIHVKHFAQQGDAFPTPTAISEKMSIDASETAHLLRELVRKGLLGIEEDRDTNGRLEEKYSLEPLYKKIIRKIEEEQLINKEQTINEEEGRIFKRFEEEFSRPLSPMEIEMISMWMDEDRHPPILIEAALRESVVSSKLNFRYIDRILFEWKKNGIETVQQAREYGEKIRRHRPASASKSSGNDGHKSSQRRHPTFNWLEND